MNDMKGSAVGGNFFVKHGYVTVGILAFALINTPVSAQSYFPNIQVSNFPDPVIGNESAESFSKRDVASSSVAIADLNFNSSPTVRKQLFDKMVSEQRKVDPVSAKKTAAFLSSTNIIDQIVQMMRPMGLRADNVADAYTLWWVIAWHAANGRQGEPDAQIMAAVKQQASNALLSTPQFASTNDAQKQEMAESMLIQAALIDAHIDAAAGNPSQQAALAQAVNQGAKKMGLDLTKMDLTENGFMPR